jgi:hypothetical protein
MIYIKKIFNHYSMIFLISFFSFDFILSNTLLDLTKKSCYQIEKFYLELKKNCNGKEKFKSGFPIVNIYTDNQGLRTTKNHKRANKNKVFIFGSSMTFGTGLEYKESSIGILEKQLPEYEFYNFSTGSYSPTAYLYQLKEQLKNNQIPEKTILFLSLADIFNEGVVWAGYDKNERPLLSSDSIYRLNEQKKNEKFIKKNFRVSRSLVHSMNSKIRVIRNKTKTELKNNYKIKSTFQGGFTYRPIDNLKPFYTDEIFFNGKKKLNKRVGEIAKILNENNVEFYLAIYPFAENLEYGQKIFNWERYTQDLCTKVNNCNFVNTFSVFKEYRKKNKNWYSDLFFIGDEHYTNAGHKLFANNLNQKIFN